MLDANFPVLYFPPFPFSKYCWYSSVFPHYGELDGNTVGPSLLSWDPPPPGEITSVTTLSPGTFMVVSFCYDSKYCWYNSAFPLNGELDCNTLGPSLLSPEPPSPREITSVPILSPGLFVEVSPPFVTSDSGSCWFSVPISGSGPCLVWSFASISKFLWETSFCVMLFWKDHNHL